MEILRSSFFETKGYLPLELEQEIIIDMLSTPPFVIVVSSLEVN